MLRVERLLPVSLPDFVLRGDVDWISLHFEDARGNVALMADGPTHLGLHLVGSYTASRETTDALYHPRVALCRREHALVGQPPPPTYPLVSTRLALRAGAFGRLAVAPELAAGFSRYLLCVKTDLEHGAELARTLATVEEGFRTYVLYVPTDGPALPATVAALAGGEFFRLEWGEGRLDSLVERPHSYARVAAIELETKDGSARLHVRVAYLARTSTTFK